MKMVLRRRRDKGSLVLWHTKWEHRELSRAWLVLLRLVIMLVAIVVYFAGHSLIALALVAWIMIFEAFFRFREPCTDLLGSILIPK